MSQPQSIEITRGGRPPLRLSVLEEFRVRFYLTTYSDSAGGRGWAQSASGRYWRLDVPPPVYQALTRGEACAVLWHGAEGLGAVDWEGHEEEPPNATAYQLDWTGVSEVGMEYEGNVTLGDKPALLGRIDMDPSPEWWLIVPDENEATLGPVIKKLLDFGLSG